MDVEELTTLYPNIPKADAFKRYVPEKQPAKTGYIPAPLRSVMPPNILRRVKGSSPNGSFISQQSIDNVNNLIAEVLNDDIDFDEFF